ncbi:MAG TPA: hypothetical protein VJ044_15235, partial [Candidatus Hodarchaeales archaeon]|nr:hypothetical protein [Candidatus Hodarchaeales archaeon]
MLFSLVFSISPLVVFIIVRKYIGSFGAFLASFLFMSQVIFLWTASVAQTNIAILFFALAVMVHFHSGIIEFSRRLLFLLFVISSVVSHYSTSYIFFFLIFLTWIGAQAITKFHLRARSLSSAIGHGGESHESSTLSSASALKTGISVTVILLFFVFIFL